MKEDLPVISILCYILTAWRR